MGEVLIYNTELTSSQVKLVEGYLAQKWDMKDDLILTHPYRYLEPVKTDSSANVLCIGVVMMVGKTLKYGKINFLLMEQTWPS